MYTARKQGFTLKLSAHIDVDTHERRELELSVVDKTKVGRIYSIYTNTGSTFQIKQKYMFTPTD